MDTLCVTRALKVLKHLQRTVPKSVPRSSLLALEKLAPNVLSNLHTVSDLRKVTKSAELRTWLTSNPLPAPKPVASDPLFKGTLFFVRITFNRPNLPPNSVSAVDVQTARNYAALAAPPIQRYASQYGPNSLSVSSTVLSFTVNLTGDTFDDGDVRGWVDKIVSSNHLTNACVVLLVDATDPKAPKNTVFGGKFLGYHLMTDNGHPYCFCKVGGKNLTIADKNNTYAEVVSHEIAEMAVDPKGDVNNPEVCDACAGNCSNDQFDLFNSNGDFIGGTNKLSTAQFTFFINSIIKPEFYDKDTQCAIKGADKRAVCIYPPPPEWNGPGTLTTVSNIVSVAGHFSTGDQRHLVVAGTKSGKVHEIFWKPAQVGIEGEDDLPAGFRAGSIVSVGSLYNSDEQRHVVVVGKTDGKVHEIFWKADTAGIEGHDDLPVSFRAGSIVAVSGLYNRDQRLHLVLVGTSAGKVREIFWRSDSVGIDGQDDLPVAFTPGSIAGVTVFYNSDQKRHVAVVGTKSGSVHEIFWKADTVGIEGHDVLPVIVGSPIVAVSGFYDSNKQRHVVAVGTADGRVHQVYWKADTVGIEAHSTVAQFSANSIVSLAGFYSEVDQIEHLVVGQTNGRLSEFFVKPDV